MDHFRNTDGYKATRTIDIASRINAVQQVADRKRDAEAATEANMDLYILGRALVEVNDEIIYEKTPSIVPHAGWDNFDAILYTWIPSTLKPDKPILTDYSDIFHDYFPDEIESTGRILSLQADLYRRFGWLAVPFGVFAAYSVFGFIWRYVFQIYTFNNALLGMMLYLYGLSYFNVRPFSSVLGSWWNLCYDAPKHLIVMMLVYVFCSYGKKMQGAVVYSGRTFTAVPPRPGC